MTDIDTILAELSQATTALTQAELALALARRDQTTSINRVNAAQKAFDEFVRTLRGSAAGETDWKRRQPMCRQELQRPVQT